MLIECTKKLADTMKISLSVIQPVERKPFYEWHANLFLFDRKKGVILMNNKTRYCVVLYGLRAEHFKKLDSLALAAIAETFTAAGFPTDKIKRYIQNCGNVVYTKTHDRSILSQINDMHLHLSWQIEQYLPNASMNMVELNLWLSQIIMLTAEYSTPIEGLKAAFEDL